MKKYEFNDDIRFTISDNIKKYRKARGISTQHLAEMIDRSYDYVRRIEAPNMKKHFSIETLYRISTVLEIGIDQLFKENK